MRLIGEREASRRPSCRGTLHRQVVRSPMPLGSNLTTSYRLQRKARFFSNFLASIRHCNWRVVIAAEDDVNLGGNRRVDPRCANASNPFHVCADYCLNKSHENNSHEIGRAEPGTPGVLSWRVLALLDFFLTLTILWK